MMTRAPSGWIRCAIWWSRRRMARGRSPPSRSLPPAVSVTTSAALGAAARSASTPWLVLPSRVRSASWRPSLRASCAAAPPPRTPVYSSIEMLSPRARYTPASADVCSTFTGGAAGKKAFRFRKEGRRDAEEGRRPRGSKRQGLARRGGGAESSEGHARDTAGRVATCEADCTAKPVGGAAPRTKRPDSRAQYVRARSATNQRLTGRLALAATQRMTRVRDPTARRAERGTTSTVDAGGRCVDTGSRGTASRDHVFPANRAIGGGERVSRGDARVVSDVSVLCPASVAEIGNSPLDIAA